MPPRPTSRKPRPGPGPQQSAPADPDALMRQAAGTYRTADGRFELREGGTGWYLVDTQRSNELGQELISGPFPTLKAARQELPAARAAE